MTDTITKKREKVLLVEDEPMVAMKEAAVLEDRGYRVEKCFSGETAVEIAERDREIGILVVDIDLGEGIDGAEVGRRVQDSRNIPVVFLTGHGEKGFVDRVREVRHYGYVVKGTGEEVLLNAVERSIEQAKEKASLEKKSRKLKTLLEAIPAVVLFLDTNTRFVDATDAGREFLGNGGAFPRESGSAPPSGAGMTGKRLTVAVPGSPVRYADSGKPSRKRLKTETDAAVR